MAALIRCWKVRRGADKLVRFLGAGGVSQQAVTDNFMLWCPLAGSALRHADAFLVPAPELHALNDPSASHAVPTWQTSIAMWRFPSETSQ